jgi:hypothetical protein
MENNEVSNAIIIESANKVTVKIPPFWVEKPEIWFFQVEAQFSINKIDSEETKFNYLVAQLEPRYIEHIWDVIKGQDENKYSVAKARLLNIFKESEDRRLKHLLTGIELGDQRPSQVLRKMKSLAGVDVSDKVIRTLWLDKLPVSVKNILIVSEENLDKLAVMADKIADMSPVNNACAVTSPTPPVDGSTTAIMKQLIDKISTLEDRVAAIQVDQQRFRSQERNFGNDRSRSRGRSRERYKPDGGLCFFHYRFGNKCRPEKCVQPCCWRTPTTPTPKENSNGQ